MSMKYKYRQADHCDACKLVTHPWACSEQDQRINPWYLCNKFVSKYTGKQSEIVSLQAQLAIANKQILEYEQTEAAVCPEDVGIKRYVQSLLNKLATAKAENEDLCDNVDAARQDLADMQAGTLEGKLQAKLDKAINALRNLHDEQNGPPLFRREKQWQAAYDEAGDILKESDHES